MSLLELRALAACAGLGLCTVAGGAPLPGKNLDFQAWTAEGKPEGWNIREQAAYVVAMLRNGETMSFRQLIAGAAIKGVVIARFLAVLELYRHSAVVFEQIEPLGDLSIRWTAEHWTEDSLAHLGADYG